MFQKEDSAGVHRHHNVRTWARLMPTPGAAGFGSDGSKCEPLRDYLEPAASILDPFELQNMRYRWRRWLVFDCNWKVAMEAFDETYHVPGDAPGVHEIRRLSRMGQGAGKAQQHRLRRA